MAEEFQPPPGDATWEVRAIDAEHPRDYVQAHTAMAAHAKSALKSLPFSSVIVREASTFEAQSYFAEHDHARRLAALAAVAKQNGQPLRMIHDEVLVDDRPLKEREGTRPQYPNIPHFKELELELKVMGIINEALVPLTPEAALRVLGWATARYTEFQRNQTLEGQKNS